MPTLAISDQHSIGSISQSRDPNKFSHIYGQIIFNKSIKFIQWEKDGLFNKYKIKREINFPTEKDRKETSTSQPWH